MPKGLSKNNSQKLTDEQFISLEEFVKSHRTMVGAATEIGIDRTVLHRTLLAKSAHPTSVKKILKALKIFEETKMKVAV